MPANAVASFLGEDQPPPKKGKERRANPEKRKREKEIAEMLGANESGDIDISEPQTGANIFGELTPELMKRLHIMLLNFLQLEDGTLINNVDLKRYGRESGEIITNTVVQEMCIIQPNMNSLNMTDCVQVSDVGLWSISRHCANIRHLSLSGCHQISNIGLRSIALKNAFIITLNFNYCHLLDDIALTVIAGGCWRIENLYLRGCLGITDNGVSRLVTSMDVLKILDLNGCINVGEYGDHGIKEIGAHCGLLKILDLNGCKRIEDGGVKALAIGCPFLEELSISGCETVTAIAFKALCKNSRNLKKLKFRDGLKIKDKDFDSFNGCVFQHSLTSIDIENCMKITDRGIAAICQAVGFNLVHIGMAATAVTDLASMIIGDQCTKLASLDLSRCPYITDVSVHTAAREITGLTTLKLDQSNKITMNAIYSHLGLKKDEIALEFAVLATGWVGYQPKVGAMDLKLTKALNNLKHKNVIKIQSALRRKFAYSVYWEKRRWWLLNRIIPKFQAQIRGVFKRIIYKEYKKQKFRNLQAVIIQKYFRRIIAIKNKKQKLKEILFLSIKQAASFKIQRMYAGMIAKKKGKTIRNTRANELMLRAKIRGRQEINSIIIQRVWKGWKARVLVEQIKIDNIIKIERLALEERMIRLIQRIMRGKLGRIRAVNRKNFLDHEMYKWRCSIKCQKVFRGHQGRKRFKYFLNIYIIKMRNMNAAKIQKIYRGYRGKILAAIAKALRILRIKQQVMAVEIQRFLRGCQGRIMFKKYKIIRLRYTIERNAVKHIQRLYRGHKGREAHDVELEVSKMEGKARPLLDYLKKKESEAVVLAKLIHRMDDRDKFMTDDIYEIERELEKCMTSHAKHCDSSRINGMPQRFLTKYLRVRLADHLLHEKKVHEAKFKELQGHRGTMRKIQQEILSTRRELLPLTTGLIFDVKARRVVRLRNKVRNERKYSIKIQSLWRRAIVRIAFKHEMRDQWIECYDEDQGEKVYYFNNWTQETEWVMPRAYKLFHQWKFRDDSMIIKKKDRLKPLRLKDEYVHNCPV